MAKPDPSLLRTQFSLKATDLAATFGAAFGKSRLMPGQYAPELTAPEDVSTGGGVRALQRLRLVPQQAGFPTLVIGGVNQKEGTAELRGFDQVGAIHQQRFKRPLPLDRAQYDQLLKMFYDFLGVMRLKVTVNNAPPDLSEDSSMSMVREPPSKGSPWVLIAVVAAILIVAAVAVVLFVVKPGK